MSLNFSNENYTCNLLCDQCNETTLNGQRCKRRVCIGYPKCWQHTLIEYGVKTAESTIPNSGTGLFATRDFNAGSYICPYIGEIITKECSDLRYNINNVGPYSIPKPKNEYIDGACIRGIGSMANSVIGRNGVSAPRGRHNAVVAWRWMSRQLWIKAIVDIDQGDEIFLYHGKNYLFDNNHITNRNKKEDTRPC